MEYKISKGSDEVVEMFCEHCYKHGNKNQPAEGFCVDCVKYFCATCLKYHRTFLPDHVQQGKDSMPVDVYFEKCKQHPNELIKFYCLSCEEIGCSTCKTAFHKHCEDIHHLPKLAFELDKEAECSDIEHTTDILEKEVVGIELIIGKSKQNVKQYNINARNTLKKQKQKVEIIFNNFEQEIVKIHNANKNQIDKEENTKDLLKADIKNIKTEIKELKNSSEKCKIFLDTKNMKEENKLIKEKLGGLKMRLQQHMWKYRYRPASRSVRPESFGRVIVEPLELVQINKIPWSIALLVLVLSVIFCVLMVTRNTNIAVEKLSDINALYGIKQICYISEHRLLVLEKKEVVHVYNPKDSNWTGQIHRAQLTDITRVRDDMVVATFSDYAEFWRISSSQSLFSLEPVFYKDTAEGNQDVGNQCEYTQHRAGKLFVVCPDPDSFRSSYIMKIFDNKESTFQSFTKEEFCFSGMAVRGLQQLYIDGKTIYFSSEYDGSITSYTYEGKVVAKYENANLQEPCRMTVDNMGNLFVCGYSSHNIFYISADLTHGYEILNKNHGIEYPYSITYNERDNILYVSSDYTFRSPIKVFKIKTPRLPYFL